MNKLFCLNENYSTTKLCYKLIDNKFLDKNGKIREDLKFKINNPAFKIQNSKLLSNPDDKFETYLFLPEGEGRKGEGGLRTKGYFKKSFDDKPLVSIITVVYNGEKYLEETIQSVINQTYDNVEYIIIDGGSTDGTLDIIKKYEDKIDYWVSEMDKGIYDAMNKGIAVASGEWIGIINSDDYYDKNSLQIIKDRIDENTYFICGDMTIITSCKKIVLRKGSDTLNIRKRMSINHPTLFVRSLIYKNKIFNTDYSIAGDYDFVISQITTYENRFKCIKDNLVFMREDGISDNVKFAFRLIKEDFRVRISNFGYKDAIYFLFRDIFIKLPKKIIKSKIKNNFLNLILLKYYELTLRK